jgi:transcription elongation factor/antiterminator RfaH
MLPDETLDQSNRDPVSLGAQQEPAQLCTVSCGSRGAEWFCAETHHAHEHIAEAELGNQSFATFLPMVFERRVKNRKIIRVEVPMFPGYVFVRFDRQHDNWPPILGTKGVRGLLGPHKSRPTPLPLDLIHAIADNATALNAEFLAHAQAKLTGQRLRVTKGPWAGFEGVCLWHRNDRVRLLMSLFGRETQIETVTSRIERL